MGNKDTIILRIAPCLIVLAIWATFLCQAAGCRQGFGPGREVVPTDQPCTQDQDCQAPPSGYQVCFDAACQGDRCAYSVAADRTCAPSRCADGILLAERTCGPDGLCPLPDPIGFSCLGYSCDPSGQACLKNCQTDGDCAGDLGCNPQGACEALRRLGAACRTAAECESARCIDGVCCDQNCGGNCDRCDLPEALGQCRADDQACTGDCDRCAPETGDCTAAPGDCTGDCAVCQQQDPTAFTCTADQTVCPGDCNTCLPNGLAFDCQATPQDCQGNCAACVETSPGQHDCRPDDAICQDYCVPSQCLAANDRFECDYSSCGSCNTSAAPNFVGACGTGIAVQLSTNCEYYYYYSEIVDGMESWDWIDAECWEGVWTEIDWGSGGDTCNNCPDRVWDYWEDTCGNTSSHLVDCP